MVSTTMETMLLILCTVSYDINGRAQQRHHSCTITGLTYDSDVNSIAVYPHSSLDVVIDVMLGQVAGGPFHQLPLRSWPLTKAWP